MHFLSPSTGTRTPLCHVCVFLKCVIFQFVKCITLSLLWAAGLIMTSASPLKGKSSSFFFKTVSTMLFEALFNLFMNGILNDTLRQKNRIQSVFFLPFRYLHLFPRYFPILHRISWRFRLEFLWMFDILLHLLGILLFY